MTRTSTTISFVAFSAACRTCKDQVHYFLTFHVDQQISAAFRRAAGLLAPEEIRHGHEKLALTQKQFANLLGVGEATLACLETGAQIQQRAMDRFLRVCLASPAAVELLRSDFQTSAAGVAG